MSVTSFWGMYWPAADGRSVCSGVRLLEAGELSASKRRMRVAKPMSSSLAALRCERSPFPIRSTTCMNRSAKPSRSVTGGRPMRLPSFRARSIPALTSSRWRRLSSESSYQIDGDDCLPGVGVEVWRSQPAVRSGSGEISFGIALARACREAARAGASDGVRTMPRWDTMRLPSRRSWTSTLAPA